MKPITKDSGEKYVPLLKRYLETYRYLITAVALTVPIVFVILLLNLRRVDLSFLTITYISTTIIGYYGLPLLLVISLLSLLLFSLRRLAAIVSGIFITLYVSFLLLDHFVYAVTKLHINLFWLEWLLNDYDGLGLPTESLVYAILTLVLVVGLITAVFMLARKLLRIRFLILTFWLITIIALAVGQIIHLVAYQSNDSRITSLTPHFPAYFPLVSHANASKYGHLLPIGEAESAISFPEYEGSLNYPLAEMKYNLLPKDSLRNFVIIFVEGWRPEVLNDEVMPNISAFSKRSVLFRNHFCTGNSTIAGTFGFFYGIDPTYWTAVKANSALIDNPVWIDAFMANDYRFGIFARSNFERHKIKDAVFRGIEVHNDLAGKNKVAQDKDMTRRTIDFIREQKESGQPFMAFAFYKSNHLPYDYPIEDTIYKPVKTLSLMFTSDDTDPEPYYNDYRNATHFVDSLAGRILAELDSLGLLDNTVVIISSEHGEEFNDNGVNLWGHGGNFTQYQIKVPLVLYAPGIEPRVIDYATSHVDIAPTMLEEFFGCVSAIHDYSTGRNLFDESMKPRPFVIGSYVNYAFVMGDNVYEIHPLFTEEYKLHDLNEEASPPSIEMLRTLMEQINRFYGEGG